MNEGNESVTPEGSGGDGCARVDEQLLDYAYGELDAATRQGVDAHLATCTRCTAALAAMSQTRRVMQSLAPEPAPAAGLDSLLDYARKAAERAQAEQAEAKGFNPWRWILSVIPLAGLAVALVTVVARNGAPESTVFSPPSAAAPMATIAPSEERKEQIVEAASDRKVAPVLEAPAPEPVEPVKAKKSGGKLAASKDVGGGEGFEDALGGDRLELAGKRDKSESGEARREARMEGPSKALAEQDAQGEAMARAPGAKGGRESLGSSAHSATNAATDIRDGAKNEVAKKERIVEEEQQQLVSEKKQPVAGPSVVMQKTAPPAEQPAPDRKPAAPMGLSTGGGLGSLSSGGGASGSGPGYGLSTGSVGARAERAESEAAPAKRAAPTTSPKQTRKMDLDDSSVADAPAAAATPPADPSAAPAPRSVAPVAMPPPPPAKVAEARTRKADEARADGDKEKSADPLAEARAAEARGERARAISLLQKASGADALFQLAGVQTRAGDLDGALQSYERFTASYPSDPRAPTAVLHCAELFKGRNRLAEGEQQLDRLERQYPESPEAQRLRSLRASKRAVPAAVDSLSR